MPKRSAKSARWVLEVNAMFLLLLLWALFGFRSGSSLVVCCCCSFEFAVLCVSSFVSVVVVVVGEESC